MATTQTSSAAVTLADWARGGCGQPLQVGDITVTRQLNHGVFAAEWSRTQLVYRLRFANGRIMDFEALTDVARWATFSDDATPETVLGVAPPA